MRRRTVLLGLTTLGGASGCLRLTADGTDDQQELTQTNTALTDDTPTLTDDGERQADDREPVSDDFDGELPRGLSTDGVSPILADNHMNTLLRESGTIEWLVVNHTWAETERNLTAHVQSGSALEHLARDDLNPATVYYGDGYWREEIGGQVTYGRHRHGFEPVPITRRDDLHRHLQTGAWNAPVPADEPGFYHLEAPGYDDPEAFSRIYRNATLESYDATATVDDQGIIRELEAHFEYIPENRDELLYTEAHYRTTDVGEVEVQEPEWLDEARANAPDVEVSFRDDRRVIELEMRDGNPMLPQFSLVVYSREDFDGNWPASPAAGTIREPVEPGDTLYLYVEDGTGYVSWNEYPEDANPVRMEGDVAVWALRTREYFFMSLG